MTLAKISFYCILNGFQTGSKRLQIGGGTSSRGKEISNRGMDYISVQNNTSTMSASKLRIKTVVKKSKTSF